MFLLMGNFKEHGVMLFLDKILYTAFIKLQADKGLGRSFAGLLPFTEGLYHLGYLSKEDYEAHIEKYSIPLDIEESRPKKEQIKCDFCGKGPVVCVFKDSATGIEKRCCAYHADVLRKHAKWKEVVSSGSV